jgi:hypothetical protein
MAIKPKAFVPGHPRCLQKIPSSQSTDKVAHRQHRALNHKRKHQRLHDLTKRIRSLERRK